MRSQPEENCRIHRLFCFLVDECIRMLRLTSFKVFHPYRAEHPQGKDE